MASKKKIAVLTSGWSIDYVLTVLSGIRSVCESNNADVYIFVCYGFQDLRQLTNYTGYKLFSSIDYSDFDGVILLANIFESSDALEKEISRIKKAGIPGISILKPIEDFEFIGCDDRCGYYDLLMHTLKEHNCKKYAYIGGPDNTVESQLRYETFIKFIQDNKLELNPDQIFLHGDYSIIFAENAAKKLLSDPDNLPDLIACVNDNTALSVISVAKTKGIRIPDDVKIIGYDNISLARKSIPSISTCDSQTYTIGKLAASRILGLEKQKQAFTFLPSIPVIGQSCGCKSNLNSEQNNLFIETITSEDESQKFDSHMRHMEDVFLLNHTNHELVAGLQNFFLQRHFFEGTDFSINLQQSYYDALMNNDYGFVPSGKLDKEQTAIVQLKNGEKIDTVKFRTKKLIPPCLESKNPSLYVFYPLVDMDSLLGYAVCKDTTKLLEKKRAYQWLRNVCNHFETYKQKSSYKILSEKYLDLATKDALSGTLNRYGYDTYANRLFEENKKKGKANTVIFIDINYMKKINDSFGHLQGDFAIKTVANSILNQIPENWLAVRYGGDEFVILGAPEKINGAQFCDKFSADLKSNTDLLQLPYDLSATLGTKTYSADEEISLDGAILEVDQLMYKNKQAFHKKNGGK